MTASRSLLGDIKSKIDDFHDTTQREVTHIGKYAVARVYGEGERPGAILAGLL